MIQREKAAPELRRDGARVDSTGGSIWGWGEVQTPPPRKRGLPRVELPPLESAHGSWFADWAQLSEG